MVKEVTVHWTIPSGIATTSVLYFADGLDPNFLRTNVAGMLGDLSDWTSNSIGWRVDQVVRTYTTTSGQLTGEESSATTLQGTGASAGQPQPDVAQALVVHHTGVVLNGRFVKGHTYLPGTSATYLTGGNLAAAAQTGFAAAFNTNLVGSGGLITWHRPKAGAGGQAIPVTNSTVNSEFAILRRRRNR